MSDDANTPPARAEYDKLVFELRDLAHRQELVAKAQSARRNATLVMKRAGEMFAKDEITGAELTRLHALRMRLDAMLPLPGDQPPALDASALRPIEGDK